jgi:hypothetical protein
VRVPFVLNSVSIFCSITSSSFPFPTLFHIRLVVGCKESAASPGRHVRDLYVPFMRFFSDE